MRTTPAGPAVLTKHRHLPLIVRDRIYWRMPDRFLQTFRRVVLGPIRDDDLFEDLTRKRVMLSVTMLATVILLLVYGTSAVMQHDVLQAALDYGLAALYIGLLFLVRKDIGVKAIGVSALLIMLGFFFYLVITGAVRGQAFVWYYTYPLMALFILGVTGGSILSLLLAAMTLAAHLLRSHLPGMISYPEGLIGRFLSAYLVVYITMLVSEFARVRTGQKLMETLEDVKDRAIRDPLTGLYNRRHLDEIMAIAMRHSTSGPERVSFLMMDLDRFKSYNDAHGHQAGDEALKAFARMLEERIRRGSDFAFRYGGEEFALVLFGANRETATEVAGAVISGTRDLNLVYSESPRKLVTASVGAVVVPQDSNPNSETVIESADQALYAAKAAGRNRCILRIYGEE